MKNARTGPILALLFTGVLLGALDIAIVGPALPEIQRDFGVDSAMLAWVFNIYILFTLVGSPLMAKLSDRFGRRTIYIVCVLLFAAGSVMVASAPSFEVLLLGRAVQAFGAAGLMPVAAAVVADLLPLERRGRALGLISAVFGVAFIIGPMLGGLLLRFSWHWLFLINLPVAAVVIVGAARLLPNNPKPAVSKFDWPGTALLSMMLLSLAWGVTHLHAEDWSGSLMSVNGLPFLCLAALTIPLFWMAEKRSADPVLHPELFGSPALRIVGAVAVATGLVEASLVFLPILSVTAFNVNASTASFMMLPLVATLLVGAPAAGRLLDSVGARPVIQAGLLLTSVGLCLFGVLPLTLTNFYLAGSCVGFGLSGLLGAPLRFVALHEAGDGRRGAGQGLLTLFLSTGRIVGAALIGGIVASGANELFGYQRALLYLSLVCALALATSVALPAQYGNPALLRSRG